MPPPAQPAFSAESTYPSHRSTITLPSSAPPARSGESLRARSKRIWGVSSTDPDRSPEALHTATREPQTAQPPEHAQPPLEVTTVAQLAVYAVEILEGSRPATHLSTWVTEEVARGLLERRALRQERRAIYRDTRRSVPRPGRVHVSRPFAQVAECAVTMHTQARSFAVALRLEHQGTRWRVTCLTVL